MLTSRRFGGRSRHVLAAQQDARPPSGSSKPASMRSSVVLPQPRGPEQREELALARSRGRDVVDRDHRSRTSRVTPSTTMAGAAGRRVTGPAPRVVVRAASRASSVVATSRTSPRAFSAGVTPQVHAPVDQQRQGLPSGPVLKKAMMNSSIEMAAASSIAPSTAGRMQREGDRAEGVERAGTQVPRRLEQREPEAVERGVMVSSTNGSASRMWPKAIAQQREADADPVEVEREADARRAAPGRRSASARRSARCRARAAPGARARARRGCRWGPRSAPCRRASERRAPEAPRGTRRRRARPRTSGRRARDRQRQARRWS